MRRISRRTKRMIAFIMVYMIVVVNVIVAYASVPEGEIKQAVADADIALAAESGNREDFEFDDILDEGGEDGILSDNQSDREDEDPIDNQLGEEGEIPAGTQSDGEDEVQMDDEQMTEGDAVPADPSNIGSGTDTAVGEPENDGVDENGNGQVISPSDSAGDSESEDKESVTTNISTGISAEGKTEEVDISDEKTEQLPITGDEEPEEQTSQTFNSEGTEEPEAKSDQSGDNGSEVDEGDKISSILEGADGEDASPVEIKAESGVQPLVITSTEVYSTGLEMLDEMQSDPIASQQKMFNAASARITQKAAANQINDNIVAANGEELTEQEKKNVEDLLASIAKVDNFVIYADSYSSTTHIDGNIAVNEYKEGYLETIKGTGDNYSYIGSATSEDGLKIGTYDNQGTVTNVATLVVGDPSITINGNNAQAEIVDISNIDLDNLDDSDKRQQAEEQLKEMLSDRGIDAGEFLDEIQIDKNLSQITQQGEAVQKAVDEIWKGDEDLSSVEASKKVLDAATEIVKSADSDTIIVLNADVNAMTGSDNGFADKVANLVKENKEVGATIVINMVIPKDENGEYPAEITLCTPINNDPYAAETAYVVWNFGGYNGKIHNTQQFTGIIVAPEASVVANGVINGRVVAKDVSHSMEIHTPNKKPGETPTPEPSKTPKPTEDPSKTPDPTPSGDPTPTIDPTPTGDPTPTIEPTPTGDPTPTIDPTPTMTPEKTPESTPAPTPTGDPTPTIEPTPTGDPTPTIEPTPTGDPTPTIEPTPTTTPEETPDPTPTTSPGETPVPTTTPGDEPTPTPEVPGGEPTPTPEVPGGEPTPTPEVPGDEPTPPPTGEQPTPPPTDEPGGEPEPTPPEITIVTPEPDVPAQPPANEVLGARRGTGAVLGARRGPKTAVLGARRRPSTGDSAALLIWILVLSAAIGGALVSAIAMHHNKKK